ncbi:ABC transporter ATP-binding protein [bacterium]|nr:ABC transporter ATP-binding protein [bacterium]
MLRLDHVSKKFGSYSAINDLDLEIAEGLIFGLLGPNGAGKTTLLRMIMGLIPPTSGKISLFDSYSPTDKTARGKIGYMPQQLAIYPGLTVSENILFFGRLYNVPGQELRQRTAEILELVNLAENKNTLVSNLSGGMIRRTMLATTLIHRPTLLILDEPTAGVDPALRIKFWNWFQLLASQGTSILITTHHIAEASRCHDVVFLRKGKLLEKGSPQDLMTRYQAKDLEEAFVKATDDSPFKPESIL